MYDLSKERINNILDIKCPKHETYPLDLLYISDKSDQHQICYMCFQTQPINKNEILNLRQILFSTDESIFQNFPPYKDTNLQKQLDELFSQQIQNDSTVNRIQQFFEDFQQKIQSLFQNLQKSMKNQIEDLSNVKINFVKTYNEISSKNQLKSLYTQNTENLNQKLHEIICSKFNDQQVNTQKIQDLVKQFSKYKNVVNFEGPQKIQEAVIQMIQQIDFFREYNPNNYLFDQDLMNTQKQNSQTNNNKKNNVNILIDLVCNQTNYCSQPFIEEVKQLLQKHQILLNQSEFKQQVFNEEKRQVFLKLSEEQLENVRIFSKKILEIDEQYQIEWQNNGQKNAIDKLSNKIQPHSFEICHYLFGGKYDQYNSFEKVFREYPMFELDNIISCQQLLFMNFIKSNYSDSQNLHIQRDKNFSIEVTKINKKGHAVCYSNIKLDVNNKYILRINIQSNPNTNNNLILFGLIPDSSKDIGYLRDTGLTYNERGDSCETFNKIVKGDPIPQLNQLSINKQVEVRIHLKSKTIRIATYPDYENISELDNKNRIKDNIEYRFAFELYQKDDKMTLTEFLVVDEFDNKI